MPEKFFDCQHPLLREPPEDVAVRYDWYIYPNNEDTKNYTNKEFKILQVSSVFDKCASVASRSFL